MRVWDLLRAWSLGVRVPGFSFIKRYRALFGIYGLRFRVRGFRVAGFGVWVSQFGDLGGGGPRLVGLGFRVALEVRRASDRVQ